MSIKEYGFHFEKQGLSGEEGPIDPAQQYFEGSHADHAIVRETGQNTLDNPSASASGPIKMEFELATMKVDDIPGIAGLRQHLDAVAQQTAGQQGHDRMMKASALAKGASIPVLRISDYNTTGLTGKESLASKGSPLSRLTRGKGGSVDDDRGGSFGIGSAVGPMASDLCTVIYTSIPEDTKHSVMAAYTRLATHAIDDINYRAEGYFTRLNLNDDFEYLRPAPRIGPFVERSEPGTDIYVLGYRMADQDANLERVRDAVIDNFLVAIATGKMVVEGRACGQRWLLDSDSLPDYTRMRPEAHAFYEALQDPNPAETVIEELGKIRLYINIDDRLERKLHTITMRRPLMAIDTFRHNSISAKYAAILVCDSEKGNKYLRQLEPPQHHEWDAAREPSRGKAVITGLKAFVRDELRDRISTEIGDEVKIEGLSRFLPSDLSAAEAKGEPGIPSSDDDCPTTEEESGSYKGGGRTQSPKPAGSAKKVRVKVRRSAKGGGESEIEQGKPRGGGGQRRQQKVGLPGTGEEGDGSSTIARESLSFRSWKAAGDQADQAVTSLLITSQGDQKGDVKLVGLGPGGEPEDSYVLPIVRVQLHESGSVVEFDQSDNTLKNVSFSAGVPTRIDVYMPAGERYRLGVL